MKVQRINLLTYDDIEHDREGRRVVVGLAEYLDYGRRYDKPALKLYDDGGDFEGWAYTVWSRLRRSGEEVPEFADWLPTVAQALPEVMERAFDRANEEIEAGGDAEPPDPTPVADTMRSTAEGMAADPSTTASTG